MGVVSGKGEEKIWGRIEEGGLLEDSTSYTLHLVPQGHVTFPSLLRICSLAEERWTC